MIEVVAYRSPEANAVMDEIQRKAIAWKGSGPKPLLHWGLENDLVDQPFLATTPLGQPYKGFPSRLDDVQADSRVSSATATRQCSTTRSPTRIGV